MKPLILPQILELKERLHSMRRWAAVLKGDWWALGNRLKLFLNETPTVPPRNGTNRTSTMSPTQQSYGLGGVAPMEIDRAQKGDGKSKGAAGKVAKSKGKTKEDKGKRRKRGQGRRRKRPEG